jgi:hypothetical protein
MLKLLIVFILLVFYIIKQLNCFQSVKIIDYITIKMIDCIYIISILHY